MFGRVQAGLGILFVWACREVLARYPFLSHGCGLVSGGYFPSFSEGLSLRAGGGASNRLISRHFPSFSEGLSLRADVSHHELDAARFPFLFGGTFIEGTRYLAAQHPQHRFPFLFGGTFIEGLMLAMMAIFAEYFPSFSEGLSLRVRGFFSTNRGSVADFPSFSEGLSLRGIHCDPWSVRKPQFPFLFGGTFIEGRRSIHGIEGKPGISLPFRRDFH